MRPFSSFTSSSDRTRDRAGAAAAAAAADPTRQRVAGRPRPRWRRALSVVGWTLVWVVAFDVAVNLFVRYPTDAGVRPTALQSYFEYGRSVRGKLRRTVATAGESRRALARAGWVAPAVPPSGAASDAVLAGGRSRIEVSVYGMSFSSGIAREVAALDAGINVRTADAPAAPPNHSYAMYQARRQDETADVVVLGLLASSVKGVVTLSHQTWQFEAPAPYTYPRFTAGPGQRLQPHWPPVRTLSDMQRALDDCGAWSEFESALEHYDHFYDPLLIGHEWADRSTILRLARRAYAQRQYRSRTRAVEGDGEFDPAGEVARSLTNIVTEFGHGARQDGRVPVVLLIHDRPYRDQLHRLLSPVLTRESIAAVSTHDLVSVDNPANFLGDGHFTPAATSRVAAALRDVVREAAAAEEAVRPGYARAR